MTIFYNLKSLARVGRLLLGLVLVFSILVSPFSPILIFSLSITAIYLLLTALTAVDPLFLLFRRTVKAKKDMGQIEIPLPA